MDLGRRRFDRAGWAAPHVLSHWTLGAVNKIKTDIFALDQALKAFAQDRGMVDKNVLPRFLGYEAEPPPIVEPFHFSAGHNPIPSMFKCQLHGVNSTLFPRRLPAIVRTLLHAADIRLADKED